MKHDETISNMFTRFTNIINGPKSLGKTYTNAEMVRKILRCIPKSWEAKVTTIQETKDLNSLSLEETLGSLMIHEMNIKMDDEDDNKKKKYIAFKSSIHDEEFEEDSSSDENEDLALIIRKFKRFLRNKK
ncbi:hypothetical protein U1Q18_052854 [Sarracenia purpurea var. burkii]